MNVIRIMSENYGEGKIREKMMEDAVIRGSVEPYILENVLYEVIYSKRDIIFGSCNNAII